MHEWMILRGTALSVRTIDHLASDACPTPAPMRHLRGPVWTLSHFVVPAAASGRDHE